MDIGPLRIADMDEPRAPLPPRRRYGEALAGVLTIAALVVAALMVT